MTKKEFKQLKEGDRIFACTQLGNKSLWYEVEVTLGYDDIHGSIYVVPVEYGIEGSYTSEQAKRFSFVKPCDINTIDEYKVIDAKGNILYEGDKGDCEDYLNELKIEKNNMLQYWEKNNKK